jgi:hypothetical protein
MGFCGARSGRAVRSWLIEPLRDSNLELFALVAVWIASKVIVSAFFLANSVCMHAMGRIITFPFMLSSVQIHELRPLAVKSLKALSDCIIADQHFTCRDFADAVSL